MQALSRERLSFLVINDDDRGVLSGGGGGWIWSMLTCGGGQHQSIRREVVELYSDRIETFSKTFRFSSRTRCFRTGRDFSSLPNRVSAKLCTVPGTKFVMLFHVSTYVIFGISSAAKMGKFTDSVKGVLYLRKSLKRMSQKRMSQKRMSQKRVSSSNEDLLSRPTIPSKNRACLSRLSYNNLMNPGSPSSLLDTLKLSRYRFHLFFPLRLQTIILSYKVRRINLHGVLRERVFVLSGRAIYILKQKNATLKVSPGTPEFAKNLSCSRRIPIRFLDRLLIQDKKLLIKFRKQSDILIEFDALVSRSVTKMFEKCVSGLQLGYLSSSDNIHSICVFRNDPRYKWKGDTSR